MCCREDDTNGHTQRNRSLHLPHLAPKLLAGLDSCEWKIWFQVHHDGRSWDKLPSDLDLTHYNLEHTELVRLCTEEYEQRGFTVSVERQNDFRLQLAGATISGRPDIVAWRHDQAVIVDAKAAKPNPSHESQVMLYMTWLPLIDPRFQKVKLSGEVYYGEEAVINIPAASVNDRFREITTGLISRAHGPTERYPGWSSITRGASFPPPLTPAVRSRPRPHLTDEKVRHASE